MKKIILFGFIAISIWSCKKAENEKISVITTETIKDSIVGEKMTINEITDSLKNFKELSKYSDETLKKIAKEMPYTYLDNYEYLKEIISIENDMINLYWNNSGYGAADHHQTLHIVDNNVIDLGNGFDKLSEINYENLDKEIRKLQKNYMYISGRSGSTIELLKNGNYLVSFRGLLEEEAEATGGSLEISYETKDIESFIPETLKVKSGI